VPPASRALGGLASRSPANQLHSATAALARLGGDVSGSSPPPPPDGSLYDTHVPLNPVQKSAVAALASLGALIRRAQCWLRCSGHAF
jgi:hypothetical protein